MTHARPMPPGVAVTPKKGDALLACGIATLNGHSGNAEYRRSQDRAAAGLGHVISVIGMDHHVALHFSPRKRTTRRSDANVLSSSYLFNA
ncbi:hypothetical protein D3C78_1708940 [compost metagenome]